MSGGPDATQLYSSVLGLCGYLEQSLGPFGQVTCIKAHGDAPPGALTSSGAVLAATLRARCPLARVVLAGLGSLADTAGDGTLFAAALVGRFVGAAGESAGRHEALWRVRVGAAAVCEAVDALSVAVDPARDPFWLAALAGTVIAPKPMAFLSSPEARLLASLCARAFVAGVGAEESTGGGQASGVLGSAAVRITRVLGAPVLCSRLVEGALLDFAVPGAEAFARRGSRAVGAAPQAEPDPVKLVLFDVSLVLDTHKAEGGAQLLANAQRGFEAAAVTSLLAAGIAVCASQKLIPASLQERLRANGILPLERLSLRFVGAVATVSGAHVLSSLESLLHPDELAACAGTVASITPGVLGGRPVTRILGCRDPAGHDLGPDASRGHTQTLVLCAPNAAQLEELEGLAIRAVSVLRLVPADPRILPGAGAWQLAAADHVRCKALSGHPREKAALEQAARALERIAATLARTKDPHGLWLSAAESRASRAGAAAAAAAAGSSAPSDIKNGGPLGDWRGVFDDGQRPAVGYGLPKDQSVVELACVAKASVKTAADIACSILRVHTVIRDPR